LPSSGDFVVDQIVSFEIRAARCEICDRAGFLQKIREISRGSGVRLICFNAEMMAGKAHVKLAVIRAVRSFESGNPISNSLEMEALLYAAGSRQTSVGSLFGLHAGENRLYVCCIPPNTDIWVSLSKLMVFSESDDPWSDIDAGKQKDLMRLFHISERELSTTHDCDLRCIQIRDTRTTWA
jgi:KEOPS complex subunit Cgi121